MSFEGMLPASFVEGGRQFFNQARMSAIGVPQVYGYRVWAMGQARLG